MFRITNFQFYCLLLILLGPVSVMELPNRLVHTLNNNAWLAIPVAVIPGFLLILMYSSIIKKSSQPFPLLLDEHLGKVLGRILGFIYIPLFFMICSFTLRLFVEFMKMNVLPATPISVFIGVLLFIGFAAIKTGLENFARVIELSIFVIIPFSVIIVFIAILNNFHLDRIRPIAYMDYRSFGIGVMHVTSVMGRMMLVLCLAFFLSDKDRQKVQATMNKAMLSYIPFIALTTMGVIITLGTIPAQNLTFPTFNMVRLARIGAFVQNIDILFIGVWVLGIFGAATIFWLIACYTMQQVFHLRDYRFLAAPSSLIIGILAILLGRTNLEIIVWSVKVIPVVYSFFFILIPFILFIITLFKPYPVNEAPESDLSKIDPLNKQGFAG